MTEVARKVSKTSSSGVVVLFLGLTAWSSAQAGPYSEFERSLSIAYAPYRAALMQTNQKDKAATEKSLQAFETAWSGLMSTYRTSPPPQYADDAGWPQTVGAIEQIIATAKADTAKGDLAKAHEVLEGVRDRLGELRARNGVVTFSDRLDAYHEQMEKVLSGKYGGPDGLGKLREDAAVLQHLTVLAQRYAQGVLQAQTTFKESLGALALSANALLEAARTGDQMAIEKAMKALKPTYAKIFVQFG